ncbi:VWA domain-containing protein [Euzebya tangerina]|uniref:VWA domain-containing protein n=1 Tax=Euzebya tangerina TaxID=591198 RepID=UPI000E322D9E|nr:VWA domain-containing protein [Euzebya tangerina]
MSIARYGRWSGTQDPWGNDLSPDEVLAEIADDLMDGVDPDDAIDDLLRRGIEGRMEGLDDLMERLRQARQAELDRMGLEGPLQQVAQKLDEIVELERTALQFADDDLAAAEHSAQLDRLPTDPAGQIAALQDYTFHDEGARQAFEDLVADLRNDVAQATFGQLASAIDATNPEDLARMRDMLAEVNGLAARQQQGEDITEAFEDFKERYGDMIPGDPETLDDLLEEMAQRMAAMNRMMAGLSEDQRRQLAELAAQAMGDAVDLQFQAQQLTQTLQGMFPELGWGQPMPGAPMAGQESGSMSQTVDWMQRLQQLDELGQALGQSYPGARLEDISNDDLRSVLGDEAAQDLQKLKEIERLLEQSGALQRKDGKLELTPKGVRRLGEQSLAKIFERALAGGVGGHRAQSLGGDAELTGSTRQMRFGDPFRLDIPRTITNAVVRGSVSDPAARDHSSRSGPDPRIGGSAPDRAPSRPTVRLAPEDFELAEAERRVKAVTVLLLDMSYSMLLRENWDPAKRLALALQSLVAGKFPQDTFHVVGFSDYARRLTPHDLLVSSWSRTWGTNMEHAFRIARRLLTAEPGAEKQVIMVTDGEPTSHLMDGGQSFFDYPPHPLTLAKSMAEAMRLSRTGCDLNVFMLDHAPGSATFVEGMVKRAGGRVFYPDLRDLGRVVMHDFLKNRAA